MKKIFIVLFLLLFITSCSNNEIIEEEIEVQEEKKTYDKVIVAFGDSLTEGYGLNNTDSYPSQLQDELDKLGYNIKVQNSGLSGETSTAALARVNWVLRLNPDIVILNIGSNDAIRGIDLQITEKNIREIVQTIKAKNITVLFAGMEIYDNLGDDYVTSFREIYPKIAEEENVPFIPLFLDGVAGNPDLNIDDRIHPNREGYEIVVNQNILPELLPLLE